MVYDKPPPPRRAPPVPGAGGGGQASSLSNDMTPEVTVAPTVKLMGDISFGRLLRVDGIVAGNINSPNGNLIVGIDGIVIAKAPGSDVAGTLVMNEIHVEGKIVGNMQVERVDLMASAKVHGNITAKSASIDPGALIVGTLNINPYAPEMVNNQGELVMDEPEDENVSPRGGRGRADLYR
jgi:cytoskeletal protein CcmA (bactofilin family)